MNVWRRVALAWVLSFALPAAALEFRFGEFRDDPDEPKWQEGEFSLPAFPGEDDLQEFYVSAVAANRFFIDAKSLSVGSDGVVRYTMVVKTGGGATNVSYEGLRCDSMEYRFYATGRTDRSWVKARTSDWKVIENKPINRYHASLSRYYFCPNRSPIRSAEEGLEALRLGKHPAAE